MNRLCSLAVVAAVIAVLRDDARACDPAGNLIHTIDPAMQASDQTPPTLPAIPDPVIHRGDGSQGGCTQSDCADLGSIQLAAVATDDMTPPDKIGYRFSLAAGALPADLTLPARTIDPEGPFMYLYFSANGAGAFDFTLQVVAIDLAGNESAPQTVRVRDDSGQACAVARGRAAPRDLGWAALLALVAAAHRRRRR